MSATNFVDYVKIYCKAGDGGSGSSHLRREKFVAKGGPDGGDGGRGGHIILVGRSNKWTLLDLKYNRHIKAENGKNGGKQQSHGANGKDIYIEVPLGTVAKNGESGKRLFEVVDNNQECVLKIGGKGGKGNWHFRSAVRQTPRYAQPGLKGQEGSCILELKVLADVGLVGLPNAGKSTLLSVITAAKPKIDSYPFTTLTPNLGIAQYHDYQSFVIADIPGIIQGAAEGKGLGHKFLRHIERNSVLLYLIPVDSKNPKKELQIIQNELMNYNMELLHKDSLIAISKCDILTEKELEKWKEKWSISQKHIFISSVSGKGINELKDRLWEMLNSKNFL